jgi:hypothetical protein
VIDRDQATREPQLAVLSVVAHRGGEVETAVSIARAAVNAVLPLAEEQRPLYSVLIEKALSEAARSDHPEAIANQASGAVIPPTVGNHR